MLIFWIRRSNRVWVKAMNWKRFSRPSLASSIRSWSGISKKHYQMRFGPSSVTHYMGFWNALSHMITIPESARSSQVFICLNAARAALGLDHVSRVLDNIFNARQHGSLESVEA
jgi:hypothetical protein